VFAALGIPVLAGRVFDERDDARAERRVVVSANFATAAFPGLALERVLGQRIAPAGKESAIIGVVGDVTLDVYGLPAVVVYHAHRQFADDRNWALTQVMASDQPPDRVLPAARDVVRGLDPELVVHRARAMADVVGRGASRERFAVVLMSGFAAVALLLAALGLYGVLAYAVAQRVREIGIRMALGATAGTVRRTVLARAAIVIAVGVAAGSAGAMLLGRSLTSLVFQTDPSDPVILLATAGLLALTGLAAAWLPARRASRIDPRVAMQDAP
jgi:hypothetical protein